MITFRKWLKKIQKKLFLNAFQVLLHDELILTSNSILSNIYDEFNKDKLNTLYTPTFYNKLGLDYFIVDCWHHRILFNTNGEDDISLWHTLTDDIRGGHTIASDGEIYVCDDTDYNALRIFQKTKNGFKQTQIIGGIETRPHFIIYRKEESAFFVLSSLGGMFWILKNENGKCVISKKILINEIKDTYVRSFSFIDGFVYLISGNGFIWKLNFNQEGYNIVDKYAVPSEISGMNYITKIEDYYYITVYQNAAGDIVPNFIRIKDLNKLASHLYEKLYELFDFKGTPYYITEIDGQYYITEIDGASGVKTFKVINNEIKDIRTLYFFNGHNEQDEKRKMEKY